MYNQCLGGWEVPRSMKFDLLNPYHWYCRVFWREGVRVEEAGQLRRARAGCGVPGERGAGVQEGRQQD